MSENVECQLECNYLQIKNYLFNCRVCVRVILCHVYHRLNGSSSHVLTATPRSYGKGQNSTPYKIKTPERIGMKFGTVDYVLEICPQNKFGDDRSSGGFWVNM